MPFGLANAPEVFQAFVNDVLREMLNHFVFVYLDDILFSDSLQEHIHHVQQVPRKLLENHLFVKLEKCEFHVPKVSFLGYVVSQEGIQMEPTKVSAITNWPQPKSLKQVQRFLGFGNFYRKFIRNFSTIAALWCHWLEGVSIHLLCGRITKTCPTYSSQNALTPGRPGGLFFHTF